jgi:hypothetical protein
MRITGLSETACSSAGDDDSVGNLPVVVQLDELPARRLVGVGVVRIAAVVELAQGRGRAEERDPAVDELELLVYVAGEHDADRTTPKDVQQATAVSQPALGARTRRPRRMMQAQHHVGPDSIERARQLIQDFIADLSGLMPDPLAVQQHE